MKRGPRFTVCREAGGWALELQDGRRRPLLRLDGMPSIDLVMAKLDQLKRAPVIVLPAKKLARR